MQLLVIIGRSTASSEDRLLIACVGDSLTAGMVNDSSGRHQRDSYPAYLKHNPLFAGYKVVNYGEGGMCATKSTGAFSYWKTSKYERAMNSSAAIVVLMLGTNDAKEFNWNETEFKKDYTAMIQGFQNMESKPTVYICQPPPMYNKYPIYKIVPANVNIELQRVIPEIAESCNVTLINNYLPLGGDLRNFTAAYISDGIHLTALGNTVMADNIAKHLLADRPKAINYN